nr:DNA primase large subunit-like isoform X1 [Megalopta genalis]XP_033330205.1 DNA primase large subunit-like isoform X1 [Megalopta genalis]
MEYTKRRRYTVNTGTDDLKDIYQHDLQMYDFPPSGEIPFVDFQQLGMDRVKLLQHVESNALRTDAKQVEERKKNLSTSLGKDGLKYFVHLLHATGSSAPSEADLQCRRKDHLSHFIMRLSCSQDPDRQAWFISLELELFKLRFSSLDAEGIEKLLGMHNIECQQITREEKDAIREELRSSTAKVSNVDISEFYKVPFLRVTDLVKSRKVYLTNGMAYIPQASLVSLFVSYLRNILIDGIKYAKYYVSKISDDERLMSFLKSLPGSFSGMTRVVWTTTATPVEKLNELSKTSYPLCMRLLHEGLRAQHHLRNSGRIQYGLFLKGIGVTMEDALHFWKTEFTKKIDSDKFDKQYAYTIRHTFGKEGKQTNYTPMGCTKIITSAVGPGEYHGCPYKHMDNEILRQKLSGIGIPVISANEIADLAKNGHYLIACTKYFEILHNRLPDKSIVHPNGYFIESRAILAKEEVTEPDTQEKFSQTGRYSERLSNTPIRRDRNFGTPSRTMDTSISTPSRVMDKTMTPVRKVEKISTTPSRAPKATPKRLDTSSLQNDEIIAQLMSEDM